jgi:uncharacterized protein
MPNAASTLQTPTPSDVDIEVRRMRYDLSGLDRHWARGSKFITHFYNALSVVFPEGEKFFINAVRAFEDQVTDPKLRAEVRAFLAQEGHHAFQHRVLNAALTKTGVDVPSQERWVDKFMTKLWNDATPAQRLGVSCAIEHYTAVCGNAFLRDKENVAGFDPCMAAIWRWHAIEETEHKGVVYDVYQNVVGSYFQRIYIQFCVSLVFIPILHLVQYRLMRSDSAPTTLRDILKGFYYLWFKPGALRLLLPDYFHYYRRSFHPWQHDNRQLLADWKRSEESQYRIA